MTQWWFRLRLWFRSRAALIAAIERLRAAVQSLTVGLETAEQITEERRADARAARADAENAERLRLEAVAERDKAMARHHADAAQLHRRLNAIHDLSDDPRIPDDLRAAIRAQTRPFERQEAARA